MDQNVTNIYSGWPKVDTFCSAHKLENVSTFDRFFFVADFLPNADPHVGFFAPEFRINVKISLVMFFEYFK